MLAAASLHVAVLIGSQPSVGRYLLPSAPVFMWCGLAALLLAIALVQTGLSTRTAMRKTMSALTPVKLATLHLVFAAMLILTLWAHIIGSAQVISGAVKEITIALLLALPLVWFAFRPRSRRSPQAAFRRITQVFTAALIPLMPSASTSRLLLEPAMPPAAFGVSFPHDRHTSVSCATCHHNFLDHTGSLACIECHRSSRTDLPRSNEATFHVFCRDCHTRLALQGLRHGPTRACSSCHP
jgi:Class III cytochrome C family